MLLRFVAVCLLLFAGVGLGLFASGFKLDLSAFQDFAQRGFEEPAPTSDARRETGTNSSSETRQVQEQDKVADDLIAGLATELGDGQQPGDRPVFEVARIAQDGVSVFAGRAGANERVQVVAEGKVVGEAVADQQGNWVVISEVPGISRDAELSLKTGMPEAMPAPSTTSNVERAGVSASSELRGKSAAERQSDVSEAVKEVNERLMASLQDLVDDARSNGSQSSREQPVPELLDTKREPQSDASADDRSNRGAVSRNAETESKAASDREVASDVAVQRDVARTSVPDGKREKRIPVPIQFVYRSAEFTHQGREAVELMRQFLMASKPDEIVLTGHADERGTPAMNLELSRQRLNSVRDYLKSSGYTGRLVLIPKGESEPFKGVDRSAFSLEDLFQLDRRVEIRLQRSQSDGRPS